MKNISRLSNNWIKFSSSHEDIETNNKLFFDIINDKLIKWMDYPKY